MDTATLESELLNKLQKSNSATKSKPTGAAAAAAAGAPPSPPRLPRPTTTPSKNKRDDAWSSDEDEPVAEANPAFDSFASELAALRAWLGAVLHAPPPPSIEALRTGIVLCQALVALTGKPVAALQTEYAPVLAAVHEFKNLEAFLQGARDAYAVDLRKRECEVADIYSLKNLPRFVRFVKALATAAKQPPWPVSAEDATAARATPASLLRQAAAEDDKPPQSAVDAWLEQHGLQQYAAPMAEAGFTTLQALSFVREEDVSGFIGKKGHVRQLTFAARELAHSLMRHEQPTDALVDDVQGARDVYEQAVKLRKDGDDPAALASRLAVSLACALCPLGRAVVADMDGEFCWVGLAGDASPLARLPLAKSAPSMLRKIVDCGVLPPAQMRQRPLFVIGPLTRALCERCFELWSRVYVCGPLSAAALALAAAGRMDGVAVEEDASGVLVSTAVLGGKPVAGATVCGPWTAALEACAASDVRQRVRRGGVVVRSQRGGRVPEGAVQLASHERWSMASRVAADAAFQHRWLANPPSALDFDGDLFPLLPAAHRMAMARDALAIAQSLGAESADAMARRLDMVNAMNLARPGFFSLEEPSDPDAPTGHAQIDAVLDTIRPVLPREAMHDARDFVIANFWKGRFSKKDGAPLSMLEIVQELPLDVRRQVVL